MIARKKKKQTISIRVQSI